MSITPKPVRSLTIAYLLILAANAGGAMLVLPIFWQLLINSCACVYIGCLFSTRLGKNKTGEIVNYSK